MDVDTTRPALVLSQAACRTCCTTIIAWCQDSGRNFPTHPPTDLKRGRQLAAWRDDSWDGKTPCTPYPHYSRVCNSFAESLSPSSLPVKAQINSKINNNCYWKQDRFPVSKTNDFKNVPISGEILEIHPSNKGKFWKC